MTSALRGRKEGYPITYKRKGGCVRGNKYRKISRHNLLMAPKGESETARSRSRVIANGFPFSPAFCMKIKAIATTTLTSRIQHAKKADKAVKASLNAPQWC